MKKVLIGVIFSIAVFIGFKLTYFDSLFVFGYDGFVITDEQFTQNLSSIAEDKSKAKINGTKVNATDIFFINNGNYYFGEENKMKFDKSYPVFINDGKALLTLDNAGILINSQFKEEETYPNLILTNGTLYQGSINQNVSNETYYFMKTANQFIINSKELTIETNVNTYTFSMNSIHNFQKDSILSYVNTGLAFSYQSIHDVDFESIVKIDSHQYSYKEFLTLLNLYSESSSANGQVDQDNQEDVSENETATNSSDSLSSNVQSGIGNGLNNALGTGEGINQNVDNDNNGNSGQSSSREYVEPKVIVSELLPATYSINAALTIEDPTNNLINSKVTFSVYQKDKLIMRKSYTENSDINLTGLEPDSEYVVVGTYAYRNENREIINHEFLNIVVKTDGISALKEVVFTGEKGDIYTNSIAINSLRITSTLDTDMLESLQTIQVKANDSIFNLSKAEIEKLKAGESITFVSNATLDSNSTYLIDMLIFDRFNNQLPIQFNTMSLTTSKQIPKVSYKFDTK